MDVLAHSLWSLVLLPGPPSLEKVVMGVMPDAAVFLPNMVYRVVKRSPMPKFQSREQMMEWYDQKENRWIKNLYRWTHSLIVWIALLTPILFFYYRRTGEILWFLLAAPLHILMDIPTHTKDSFPVQFLTPLSRLQINGVHWSNRWVLIGNYSMIALTFVFRILKTRGVLPV